jgi:hypothetical protein
MQKKNNQLLLLLLELVAMKQKVQKKVCLVARKGCNRRSNR